MASKEDRQRTIRQVVQSRPVATQPELIKTLRARRIEVRQSTLSRDLTELGIRKVGGRYVPPDRVETKTARVDYAALVRSFTICGSHLIVIRTAVGQAQPVALSIDAADDPAIAATLAGDDVIFVATKTRRTQVVALRRLQQWFGGDKYER